MHLKLLSFFITLTIVPATWATKPSKRPKSAHAVVQFIKGYPVVKRKGTTKNLQFKDLVFKRDKVSTNKAATIKIVTKNSCQVVLYGNSKAKIAQYNYWGANAESSLRVICPSTQSFTVRINANKIKTQAGEFIFTKNELISLKGITSVNNNIIKNKVVYKIDGENVKLTNENTNYTWNLDQKLNKPVESLKWPKPTKKQDNSWWSAGPYFGGSTMSHGDHRFSLKDFDEDGFRLQTNLKFDNWSVIGSLDFIEGRNFSSTHNNQAAPNSTEHNRVESVFANVGLRFNRGRNWSWYSTIGIGEVSYEMHMNFENPNTYLDARPEFIALKITGGVDYFLKFDSMGWFGVLFAAELHHMETISKSNDAGLNFSGSIAEYNSYDDGFTTTGLGIYIAPTIRF